MNRPRDWHNLLDRDASYGAATHRGITCGTAAIQVLQANSRRKRAVLINDSDTVIYLFKAPPASCALNAGIRLNATGGSWEESADTLGYLYRGQFSAITSAATKVLTVIEEM